MDIGEEKDRKKKLRPALTKEQRRHQRSLFVGLLTWNLLDFFIGRLFSPLMHGEAVNIYRITMPFIFTVFYPLYFYFYFLWRRE